MASTSAATILAEPTYSREGQDAVCDSTSWTSLEMDSPSNWTTEQSMLTHPSSPHSGHAKLSTSDSADPINTAIL